MMANMEKRSLVDTLGNWRGILGRLAAEFSVVVLGVTIALWADGWVAERSDRTIEAARLIALQDNVNVSLARLREARDNAEGAADALRKLALLEHRDRPEGNVEELLRYGLLYGPTFYPELNVYDDLKNSGELALLTNPELRRSLAAMDSRLEFMRFAQADLAAVQQLNVDSYMINQLDLSSFYGSITGLDIEASKTDLGFTSDMKFRNIVLHKLDLVTQLEVAFQNLANALEAVQQSIVTSRGDGG
jgi:hypothetical protein